jgi:hypothetical protein
MLRKMLSWQRS